MSFISKQRPLSESDNAQDIADDEELFDIEVCNFFSTTIIHFSS